MKKTLILLVIFNIMLWGESNSSESNSSNEINITQTKSSTDKKTAREKRIERNIQKQIAKEKKFGIEQTFYHGKEYDLKESEIDEESVSSIPEIDDDIEFDMDDVYD